MNDSQVRDVSKAVLTSMTEEELANWHRAQGKHIICHRGRYWKETVLGFYEPIHWIANLSAEQATCPIPLCWGFRASLSENDAMVANGSMPVYILPSFQNYDLQSLSSNRKYHLRKCRKLVKIMELIDPVLLQEQGYEVFLSAAKRVGILKVPLKEDYLANLSNYISPQRRLVLVGLIDDQLGGYITGYAINGTAYIEHLYVDTDALTTNISLGLTFEFVQVCRRSSTITQVVHGQHRREDPKLCLFKESTGFAIKHIPYKVWMNPIIEKFIRWRYPDKYYRLTGND